MKQKILPVLRQLYSTDGIGLTGLALIVTGVSLWTAAGAMVLAGAMMFTYAYVMAGKEQSK